MLGMFDDSFVIFFGNTFKVSNSLDPELAPDLVPNRLQRLSAEHSYTKLVYQVIYIMNIGTPFDDKHLL